MRIAAVTSYFPNSAQPYRGHSAFHTLREMAHRADVRVFCPLTCYPSWLRPRNFPYSRTDLSHIVPNLPTEYFEYPAIPVLSRPFNPAVCARALGERLAAFRPDVILNYFVYPEGCAAVSIGEKLQVPVVLGAIGSDVNRIPDRVTEWHTRRALKRAASVIAVSRQLADRAVALGADRSRVAAIPNGCDTAVFHPHNRQAARARLGLPDDAQLILFVGWLAPSKGVRELLGALAELAARHPNLRAAFVGEGALLSEINARGESGALAGRLIAPGVQPSSSVAIWMAASDVFCLPSYAEGCPNVVLEALASGRPVVASSVGAIPELIDADTGILVAPRDAQALARALDSALNQPWDATRIAARFHRSWRAVADETWAVCDSAVRRAGIRPDRHAA